MPSGCGSRAPAGARFLDIGMDDVAAAEPMPAADLAAYAKAGRA
jgi:hypothetical protein